jgi:hypothetical protein
MLNNPLKQVSLEEYERRIKICFICPNVRNTKTIGLTCGVFMRPDLIENSCGCKLSWKAKLESQTGNCPLKKW